MVRTLTAAVLLLGCQTRSAAERDTINEQWKMEQARAAQVRSERKSMMEQIHAETEAEFKKVDEIKSRPKATAHLKVFNHHLDALLSVYSVIPGDLAGERALMVGGRMRSREWTTFPAIIQGPVDAEVVLRFKSRSLGSDHVVLVKQIYVQDGATLEAEYSFDPAEGEYTLKADWK